MLFNTLDFVLFLPLVIIGYYLTPAKYRWVLLLAASYYFYMCWKLEYIVLILVSTLIDYFCAREMGKHTVKKKKRPFLLLSIVTNLGLLMGFKYFNFFSTTTEEIFSLFDVTVALPSLNVLLPVGISFYTFQTMSYSIDVYQGKQTPEKHLGYFALYVSFFPQLVAGPIERFSSLAPQLKQNTVLNRQNIVNGLRLILFGLFTKMVIADNLAPLVDTVYANPEEYTTSTIATALTFYSFQIYGDFFGYSLIAIGSARLMGIHLMDNFKTPYLSRSIAEFWQRWHISLSTWFRDYLYFPMGGNRTSKFRWGFNILVVFTVSGFWHGANLTFLIWGLIFAVSYLVENTIISDAKNTPPTLSFQRVLLAIKTFVIITLAWVFFRSDSVSDALSVFSALKHNNHQPLPDHINVSFLWGVLVFFILLDVRLFNSRYDLWVAQQKSLVRWTTYFVLLFAIIVFAGVADYPFIYFQF